MRRKFHRCILFEEACFSILQVNNQWEDNWHTYLKEIFNEFTAYFALFIKILPRVDSDAWTLEPSRKNSSWNEPKSLKKEKLAWRENFTISDTKDIRKFMKKLVFEQLIFLACWLCFVEPSFWVRSIHRFDAAQLCLRSSHVCYSSWQSPVL